MLLLRQKILFLSIIATRVVVVFTALTRRRARCTLRTTIRYYSGLLARDPSGTCWRIVQRVYYWSKQRKIVYLSLLLLLLFFPILTSTRINCYDNDGRRDVVKFNETRLENVNILWCYLVIFNDTLHTRAAHKLYIIIILCRNEYCVFVVRRNGDHRSHFHEYA